MVVSGSSSADPVVSSGEPCTDMVVAGSASAAPSTAMLGVRTSSRHGRGKHYSIGFDKQGFFKMVDIYNKFAIRVCDKLFGDDAAAIGGAAAAAIGGAAAGGAPKFTVQELHKLKTDYDKGAAWTAEEVQELRALPLIMLKAHWKDEHQLNTFREQLTNLMKHVSELQKTSGKHDHEIAALKQVIAELRQCGADSLSVAAGGAGSSVVAAGGAGSSVVAAGASAVDLDARLKKLEAGPGYTRESIKEIQAKYVVNAPMTEEERASWDEQPLILRKFQWRVNYNNECILKRITKLEQQALPKDQPVAAGSAVVAAGASVADLDSRLKKLEAGTGHTREEIRKIKAGYDVTKDLTDEEFTQLAGIPLILQKTHWRFHHNVQASWNRISGVKKETAELKQALATEQQATAELKQALAKEQQATAELKQALALEQQATASQAQEIAALKQAMATQGQAVQSMDAHTAQIMQAVQAMMGPMHGELVELRRRVAMLEAARPAGVCMAVKPIKKEPA
jgi:hypothetical protein